MEFHSCSGVVLIFPLFQILNIPSKFNLLISLGLILKASLTCNSILLHQWSNEINGTTQSEKLLTSSIKVWLFLWERIIYSTYVTTYSGEDTFRMIAPG